MLSFPALEGRNSGHLWKQLWAQERKSGKACGSERCLSCLPPSKDLMIKGPVYRAPSVECGSPLSPLTSRPGSGYLSCYLRSPYSARPGGMSPCLPGNPRDTQCEKFKRLERTQAMETNTHSANFYRSLGFMMMSETHGVRAVRQR